jgi:hypothetical protein
MAVNIPNDDYCQDPRVRNGSGVAQGNTRQMETAMPSPTEQESKVIGMVLKALNDLKSDMGTVKKILNISDGTKATYGVYPQHKPGYRASENERRRGADSLEQSPRVQRSLGNMRAPHHNR